MYVKNAQLSRSARVTHAQWKYLCVEGLELEVRQAPRALDHLVTSKPCARASEEHSHGSCDAGGCGGGVTHQYHSPGYRWRSLFISK